MVNRTCLTCGKKYEYCSSCPTTLNYPMWKNLFDTENCKTVFETVSDYEQKVITKDLARKKLLQCNLSQNLFVNSIQRVIDEIEMTAKKKDNKTAVTNKNQLATKVKTEIDI